MTAPFSEADVELAAQAMRDANTAEAWRESSPLVPFAHYARAVLDALAATGRLLSEGTRSQEQFAARVLLDGKPVDSLPEATTRERAQARVNYHARMRAENPGWRGSAELVRRWQHTTPWEPVDSSSVNSPAAAADRVNEDRTRTPEIIVKRTCGHCCGPMLGYASHNNTWLCHPEEGMDCYRLVTILGHGMPCASCSALRATTGALAVAEESPVTEPTLEEALHALADVPLRFRFWTCPVAGHSDRNGPDGRPVVTVEWRDDVAYCTAPGCGRNGQQTTTEEKP